MQGWTFFKVSKLLFKLIYHLGYLNQLTSNAILLLKILDVYDFVDFIQLLSKYYPSCCRIDFCLDQNDMKRKLVAQL